MALSKQAKHLSKTHIQIALGYLEHTRLPIRNRVIFLLSVRAGLRAREIALLTWGMVLNPDGEVDEFIRLEDGASKGRSGRVIPIASELRESLIALREVRPLGHGARVIYTERRDHTTPQVIVNLFCRWFDDTGLHGCSSHSGRRTFITNAARKISTVGGSLRDVQMLAGHSSLRVTQGYIDGEQDAQKKIVELV